MLDKPNAILSSALSVPYQWVHENPGILAQFTYAFKEKVDFGWNVEDSYELITDVPMYQRVGDYYEFARGNLEKIYSLFGGRFNIIDQRCNVPLGVPLTFKGTLKDDQKEGLRTFIEPNIGGIFQAAPGYGKTVVMVAYVTLVQQKTLLLVNKTDLKHQFVKRARDMTNLLDIEAETGGKVIGELSFDKHGNPITYPITVSTYQLIAYDYARLEKIRNMFGLVLVDECHRAPADCLTRIIKGMNPLLFMGVSATPWRKDGYHRLLPDLVGPVRFKSTNKNTAEVEIARGRHYSINKHAAWPTIIGIITKDMTRNRKIVDNVTKDVQAGRKVIVLSDRVEHCEVLFNLLKAEGIKAAWLTGGADQKLRDDIINKLDALNNAIQYVRDQTVNAEEVDWDEVLTWEDFNREILKLDLSPELTFEIQKIEEERRDCLCATAKLFGEGSDIPALDTLHIVCPTSNQGFIEQAIGRVQREYPRKKLTKVVFIADSGHGILYGCAKKVRKVCSELLNYTVTDQKADPTQKEII
jgi:superfamily II DNA or RNA helicase